MRYGLISDIHANLAAIRAAVDFLDDVGVDAYLCAGDVVGYGPQPNECVEMLAQLPLRCVAGNHDLIATGQLDDRGTGALARRSLAWTRSVLSPAARAWLEALPRSVAEPGLLVAHGSIDDPRRYVDSDAGAASQLAQLAAQFAGPRLLILGHTHRPTAYGERRGRVLEDGIGTLGLGAAERWLLNPGAIGQARGREPDARVAVLDTHAGRVEFHALRYDVAATIAELRRHGLPAGSVHLRRGGRLRSMARRLIAT